MARLAPDARAVLLARLPSFSAACALLTLMGCDERLTAPADVGRPRHERLVPTHLPNDRGATRAEHLVPVSETPLGPPPASDRAVPLRYPGLEVPPPMPRARDPQRAASGAEAAAAAPSSQAASGEALSTMLRYHGGVVQTSPRLYLIYWGASWLSDGDPDGVASRLNAFYKGLGGSGYAEVLRQYAGSTTTFTNPVRQYRGWRRDTSPVPAHPTKAQLETVVRRAATALNDFSYNAQYVVATPWGVSDQRVLDHHWCAWHSMTAAGPAGHWVTFTSLPYMPYLDEIGMGCGGGAVNGLRGVLDGVTILAAHEYGESVNDPGFDGWFDAEGEEIADKCSWTNLANYTLLNGLSFPVQPQWGNRWMRQQGSGCLYS
jgi:hypothetical protein